MPVINGGGCTSIPETDVNASRRISFVPLLVDFKNTTYSNLSDLNDKLIALHKSWGVAKNKYEHGGINVNHIYLAKDHDHGNKDTILRLRYTGDLVTTNSKINNQNEDLSIPSIPSGILMQKHGVQNNCGSNKNDCDSKGECFDDIMCEQYVKITDVLDKWKGHTSLKKDWDFNTGSLKL